MPVSRLLTQKRPEEEAILFAYLHLWLHAYGLSDGRECGYCPRIDLRPHNHPRRRRSRTRSGRSRETAAHNRREPSNE
jgi:hypothetical protein